MHCIELLEIFTLLCIVPNIVDCNPTHTGCTFLSMSLVLDYYFAVAVDNFYYCCVVMLGVRNLAKRHYVKYKIVFDLFY